MFDLRPKVAHLLLKALSPKARPTNSNRRFKATPPAYQLWRRLRASSARGKDLVGLMVLLRPARPRLTTTTLHPRLLAVIAGLHLMAPLQAHPLRRPTNTAVVTHHPTHHHLPSRRRSRVLLQDSQAAMAMAIPMERVALHRPSQVLPQASQVVLDMEQVAMERVALHHPSQARARPSLAVAMDLPQVRLVDTDLHKGLLLLMEAALASLTLLVDLAVTLLLVHRRSGSQVRSPMAHHLAAGRSSLVRLEVGRRSRMVVAVVVVGGEATLCGVAADGEL